MMKHGAKMPGAKRKIPRTQGKKPTEIPSAFDIRILNYASISAERFASRSAVISATFFLLRL